MEQPKTNSCKRNNDNSVFISEIILRSLEKKIVNNDWGSFSFKFSKPWISNIYIFLYLYAIQLNSQVEPESDPYQPKTPKSCQFLGKLYLLKVFKI